MAKILVVDDDLSVSQMIVDHLEAQHHTVEAVYTGADALDRLRFYSYDLAILDWQLPQMSGVAVCKEYREHGGRSPILMLTGRNTLNDKETGFDAGADDYLTKPFEVRELAMRVKALLRRPQRLATPALVVGDFTLDHETGCVVRNEETIQLLPREFALLDFLARYPNQFFTPEQLLNRVWEAESEATIGALRASVKRLRQSLDQPGKPSIITSLRGYGYKLDI